MTFQEQLHELVDRALTRRQFLAKLGAATLGAALTMIRAPFAEAHGYEIACCHLCRSPGNPCSGPCPTQTAAGQWCWHCVHSNGYLYRCCECKTPGSPCDRSCAGVWNSYIQLVGYGPSPELASR